MKHTHFLFKLRYLTLTGLTLASIPFAQAEDIKFSGFLSVGGGLVDDEKSIPYGSYREEDLTFDNNLLGLQVTGKISDKLTATAQMIARSSDNYSLNAEWAYLTWQVSDNTKVRAGRLRTPFYMFSDSLDVGYSYAWITPPREVYSIPFNNVDGIDIYNTWNLGSFDTTVQAYFGTFEDDVLISNSPAAIRTRNQMGLVGTLGKDWWTLRAAYHQADLTISSPQLDMLAAGLDAAGGNGSEFLIDGDTAAFAELGLNIDTGKFVAALEHVELTTKHSFQSKNIREYVMGGVRMGDLLFHITASRAKDELTESTPEAGVPVVPQTAVLLGTVAVLKAEQLTTRDVVSVGLRWDVTSGTALKFQVDDVDDSKGDQKVFSVAVQTVF